MDSNHRHVHLISLFRCLYHHRVHWSTSELHANCLAPEVGFEPTTQCLIGNRSTLDSKCRPVTYSLSASFDSAGLTATFSCRSMARLISPAPGISRPPYRGYSHWISRGRPVVSLGFPRIVESAFRPKSNMDGFEPSTCMFIPLLRCFIPS